MSCRSVLLVVPVTLCCVASAFALDWVYNPANEHFYALGPPLSRDEAALDAQGWGGYLASVTNAAEQDWLVATFGVDEPLWLGLSDEAREGTWLWSSGEAVFDTHWSPGQPDDGFPSDMSLNPDNGHGYGLSARPLSWSQSQSYSRSRGGHLVSISSAEEQAWLVTRFADGQQPFWIGFTDQRREGTWEWTTREPVTFLNWRQGEPNDGTIFSSEDYAVMNWERPGKWNDLDDRDGPYQALFEIDDPDSLSEDYAALNLDGPGTWGDAGALSVYRGIIEVPAATDSFKQFLPAALHVTLEPAAAASEGARWRLDGGPWRVSGATLTDLEPGHYTVEVEDLARWEEPANLDVFLIGAATVEETLSYLALPSYAVGDIPPTTAWHGRALEFLVDGGSLVAATPMPIGVLDFQVATGLFRYLPDAGDRRNFEVTFSSGAAEQTIQISPLAHLPPEQATISYERALPDPAGRDFLLVTVGENPSMLFNHQERATKDVTIVGPTVVFEEGFAGNDLYEIYHQAENIYSLTIHAEVVIIRDPLHLPQTKVTIRARELRFEDPAGSPPGGARIVTTPVPPSTLPETLAEDSPRGADGLAAGSVDVAIERFHSDPCPPNGCQRFVLVGGAGGEGGPGADGQDGETLESVVRTTCFHATGCFDWNVVYIENCDSGAPIFGTRAWPTDGTDAIAPGQPGTGGAGGNLLSNLPLGALADLRGGRSGARGPDRQGGAAGGPDHPAWGCEGGDSFSITSSFPGGQPCDPPGACSARPGADAPAPGADAPAGPDGSFASLPGAPTVWLEPLATEAILSYVRAAYLSGNLAEVRRRSDELLNTLEAVGESLPVEFASDFDQATQELYLLRDRVLHNLDYFGNPAGWVPMLSFEANRLAFEREVEAAIPILYLSYWLRQAAEETAATVDGLRETRERIREELPELSTRYKELEASLPQLEVEVDSLTSRIVVFQQSIEARETELLERAEQNVEERHKVPFWKKGLRIVGSVLKMVPVYQPALAAVGTGLEIVSHIDTERPLESLWDQKDVLKEYKGSDFKNRAAEFRQRLLGIDWSDSSNFKQYSGLLDAAAKQFGPGLEDIQKTLKDSEVPRSEIEAELEKLRAEDPALSDLVERASALLDELEIVNRRVLEVTQELPGLAAAIQQGLLAVDAIEGELAAGLERLEPRTLAYVSKIERRTKDRLLRYQYLLAKAFEYRTLLPYDGELDLNRLFERFHALVSGHGHDLPAQEFTALQGIYVEELRRVTALMFEELNANAPERSVPIAFGLSPQEIETLNRTGQVTLNLFERGIFGHTEENLRLVDLRTQDITVRPVGGEYGATAILRLRFEHSGASWLTARGEVYRFEHYRTGADNPISWKTVYDGITGTWDETTLSEASASLLRLLLDLEGLSSEDLVLYSRPAAWADLTIHKEVTTDNGTDMLIDALRLEVEYDYFEKRTDRVELAVEVPGSLLPNILVDVVDGNGRQDGRGDFHRVYTRNQLVTLNAQERYGLSTFERWTDEHDNDFGPNARSPDLVVALEDHVVLRAVYSRPENEFVRGDCDQDGFVGGNVADAIFYLNWAFSGMMPPSCLAACDIDGDGFVGGAVNDPLYYLSWAFLGGPPPPTPFPDCGPGTASDAALGCALSPVSCQDG